MVLISFKSAKTKKHIANFRFSYQIQSVVHYVDYLSEDITQGLFMFLASKRLRLPISSERNRPFLRKERETHISSERIRFGYLPWDTVQSTRLDVLCGIVKCRILTGTYIVQTIRSKGTSRQRSGKGATRERFPLQKPRWEKTKVTTRHLYHKNISQAE